jgi:hypothetical protein
VGGSEIADDAKAWKIVNATGQACSGPCPTSVQLDLLARNDLTGAVSDFDIGWTGFGHDQHLPSGTRLTLGVIGCAGSDHPSCGECTVSGPLPNAGGAAFDNHRCVGDTRKQCSTDADCGADGPCHYFLGAPEPLAAGGVSACLVTEITAGVTGTIDVEGGSASTSTPVRSRWYSGITLSGPAGPVRAARTTAHRVRPRARPRFSATSASTARRLPAASSAPSRGP